MLCRALAAPRFCQGAPLWSLVTRRDALMTDRDQLALPISATVAALYLVPATFPDGQLAQLRSAISSRVAEPVRSLALRLLDSDVLAAAVRPARTLRTLAGVTRGYGVTGKQAVPVTEAEFFAAIGAELRPGSSPVHEWVARAAAAALAADQGVPVVDACTWMVVHPRDLLDSLPGSDELAEAPHSFMLAQWLCVRPRSAEVASYRTQGLVRFGLPELTISDVPGEHAEHWEFGLYGLAHQLYSRLRNELLQGRQPTFLAVPAEVALRPADVRAAGGFGLTDTGGLPVRLSLDVTVGETYDTYVAVGAPLSWTGSAAQHRAALRDILLNSARAAINRN